jgi:anti-sigma B factor antagonist
MPYETSISGEGAVTLVTIKGTIVGPDDRETIQMRIRELLEQGRTNLILDLGQVTFVDSGGIGGLIAISNLVMRKSGCMKLLYVTKKMHDILQITRLSSVFRMYDDLQRTLESFDTLG